MAKGPKLPGAPVGDIDPNMMRPEILAQIQKYQQEQLATKKDISAALKGSITPVAHGTEAIKEVSAKQNPTDVGDMLKEQKQTNTHLASLIKVTQTSIENNNEVFGRLDRTMNSLLDAMSEQTRDARRIVPTGTGDGPQQIGNVQAPPTSTPSSGGGFNPLDLLGGGGKDKPPKVEAPKGKPSKFKRAGKGILGAVLGGLGAMGLYAALGGSDGEDNGTGEALVGGAGAVAGGAVGAFGDKIKNALGFGEKTETPKVEAPKVEPKIEVPKAEEPRYKFNEKTGRFHDTMSGPGGGKMISNEEAKGLGLEKNAASDAAKNVTKKSGVEAAKDVAKKGGPAAVKEAVAKLGPKFAKELIKAVPFVGALAGLAFAISRASEGDFKGAAAEAVGGAASVFAGPGTAISVATDVGLLVRDAYKSIYDVFPDDDPLVGERLEEVQSAAMEYVSSLLPGSSKNEEEQSKTTASGEKAPPANPIAKALGVDSRGLHDAGEGEIMPTVELSSARSMQKSAESTGTGTKVEENYNSGATSKKVGPFGSTFLGSLLTREGGDTESMMGTSMKTVGTTEKDAETGETKEKVETKLNDFYGTRKSGGFFGSDKYTIHMGGEEIDLEKGQWMAVQKLVGDNKIEEAVNLIKKVQERQKPQYDPVSGKQLTEMEVQKKSYMEDFGIKPKNEPAPLDQIQASMNGRFDKLQEAPTPDQTKNSAPIIVNNGGDVVNNVINNSASGGGNSGGGGGGPSKTPSPFDGQIFGRPWAYTP
jgi:hypothetical protein